MKILVVDDHPLIVHALSQMLPDLAPDFSVLAAVNRDETLALLARHPDCTLVLLGLALPGAHVLDLLAELRRRFPRLPSCCRPARSRHAGRMTFGSSHE